MYEANYYIYPPRMAETLATIDLTTEVGVLITVLTRRNGRIPNVRFGSRTVSEIVSQP